MATPDYGEVRPRYWPGDGRFELHIEDPPEHALITIGALHDLPNPSLSAGPNRIYAGVDFRSAEREHVFYQVVGWDADRKALILHREAS